LNPSLAQPLTLAQWMYTGALACYLIFFLLFLRFFWWKFTAERKHWQRRPPLDLERLAAASAAAAHPVPRFTVLVPARNEADVIAATVEHLLKLEYPADKFELLVVTDAKEERAAREDLPQLVATVHRHLRAGRVPAEAGDRVRDLSLAALIHLAQTGWAENRRPDWSLPGPEQSGLAPASQRYLAWELARGLVGRRPRHQQERVAQMLRRRRPEATPAQVRQGLAGLLALALPALVAAHRLAGHQDQRSLQRLIANVARAHHDITQELLYQLADTLARDILLRVERAEQAGELAALLTRAYQEIFPTTQDVVAAIMAARPAGALPALRHVSVPADFDGALGGACVGHDVASTKGRALNWAMQFVNPESTWCGFYDAESRPDPRVLLYVAQRWLTAIANRERIPRIFQGPVFQVRNFTEMSPVCKIAALYQSIAHDWILPSVFKKLPFVGGTNVFVERHLLQTIGGFDRSALTEDLELGTRAYLRAGAWPEFLPLPSSEQTPPTFKGFYRQRLRWASGHLQVYRKIKREVAPCPQRRRLLRTLWLRGHAEWTFYQLAILVPIAVLVLQFVNLMDPSFVPAVVRSALGLLTAVYPLFTVYAYIRYFPFVDAAAMPVSITDHLRVVLQLMLLPIAAFFLPLPYSSALVLDGIGKGPQSWVKTPRTRE
jgi:cellulose synthase/poly-beta-1,6-N-acetylglucosamine synthase-like glycosyltransferase